MTLGPKPLSAQGFASLRQSGAPDNSKF